MGRLVVVIVEIRLFGFMSHRSSKYADLFVDRTDVYSSLSLLCFCRLLVDYSTTKQVTLSSTRRTTSFAVPNLQTFHVQIDTSDFTKDLNYDSERQDCSALSKYAAYGNKIRHTTFSEVLKLVVH